MIRKLDLFLLAVAALLVPIGSYLGLVWAPTERAMGDVYRIIFVHVPCAWMAMIAFVVTAVASLTFLFKRSFKLDAAAEASAEVGVVLSTLLVVTGSIWGKPTWGVWWTWDPRLTTVAIMLIAFAGYLALRKFVDEPERRATWSAVTAVIISASIPMVWFSVKWWNTLHQVQSSPQTLAPQMLKALWFNVFAYLFVYLFLVRARYLVGRARQRTELLPPPAVEQPQPQGAPS